MEQTAERIRFDFLPGLPIVVEPKATRMSSDAGMIPIRQFDDQIGFTDRFVAGLELLADLVVQNTTNPPGNEYLAARVAAAYREQGDAIAAAVAGGNLGEGTMRAVIAAAGGGNRRHGLPPSCVW